MYRYVEAIKTGIVPPDLTNLIAGSMNHARWLTLSIRLLQLYTRTETPDDSLIQIVRYIVQVYAPMWFEIRSQNNFVNGPKLIFRKIELVKTQSEIVQNIVKPVIQRNSYFAEPGIILCSWLLSENQNLRTKALEIVKTAKEKPVTSKLRILKGIRQLKIPPLNWNASDWTEIVDLSRLKLSLPSIITELTVEDLENIQLTPRVFPRFPLHSTSVERAVRLVSEASGQVCGSAARHKHILAKLKARKLMPAYDTKSKFNIQ